MNIYRDALKSALFGFGMGVITQILLKKEIIVI